MQVLWETLNIWQSSSLHTHKKASRQQTQGILSRPGLKVANRTPGFLSRIRQYPEQKASIILLWILSNPCRNKLVHNLTKHTSIEDIKRQSSKIKEIFDSIFEIYDEVYDGFRVDFSHQMRNGDWDEWLEELEE